MKMLGFFNMFGWTLEFKIMVFFYYLFNLIDSLIQHGCFHSNLVPYLHYFYFILFIY